jgi:hypothetical protein
VAQKYLYSGAAGAADGSSWANAYTTLSAACAGLAAGDTLFVADDHNENTAASVTVTSPGTFASFARFICAKRVGGSVPPVSADLKVSAFVKATAASHTLSLNGCAYVYGIHLQCGNGSGAGNVLQIGTVANSAWYLEGCHLFLGTSAAATIVFGAGSASAISLGRHTLKNCVIDFSGTGQGIQLANGGFDMIGGSFSAAVTTLLLATDLYPGLTTFRGVDLSIFGAGNTLCGAFQTAQRVVFEHCKLNASAAIAAAQVTPGVFIDVIGCDSGTAVYRNERYQYGGSLTTETTVVLTGGATDGATPFSHEIATNANANINVPFESFPMIEFYAGATGIAVVQTYELMTDNVTLTNADAWVDLEYLGSSSSPQASVASSAPANPLAAASNLTASTAVWNTTGLTTPKPQKIALSFTPQLNGFYRATLKVAKPSTTLWLNPPSVKAA